MSCKLADFSMFIEVKQETSLHQRERGTVPQISQINSYLRIIALQHLHRTTGGKAAVAVLLPMVLLWAGLAALSFAVIALAMTPSR